MHRTVDPRLGTRRVMRAVVAEHRSEGCDLVPAGQQVGARAPNKPADIAAAVREAR